MNILKTAAVLFSLLLFVWCLAGCTAQSPGYETVQDYIESPMMQELLAFETQHPKEDTGFVKTVRAEGNTLFYEYTFEEPLDLSDPDSQARVEAYLMERCTEMTAEYDDIHAELYSIVPVDGIVIRLVYKNTDGSVIYEHEYP